jgi:hypothetical protein
MATISAPIYRVPSPTAPLRRAARFGLGAALRIRTAVGREALDMALVQGADRSSRPELALRATQLERPEHRRALSKIVRRACQNTTNGSHEELRVLADRLDSPQPAAAAGIAMAARLVGNVLPSRLFAESDPQMVGELVHSALATMDDERVALGLGSGPLSVLLLTGS